MTSAQSEFGLAQSSVLTKRKLLFSKPGLEVSEGDERSTFNVGNMSRKYRMGSSNFKL
jgi:hypothetical protein